MSMPTAVQRCDASRPRPTPRGIARILRPAIMRPTVAGFRVAAREGAWFPPERHD
jgi:hypothetical protein